MTTISRSAVLTVAAGLLIATGGAAQTAPAAMDSLLSRLVGRWTMTGTVRGEAASHSLDAARVLQDRFVELHIMDAGTPPAYEARVFIGVDSARSQSIAH